MLAAALSAHDVPHKLIVYPGVDHGVGPGRGLACEDWLDEAVAFWKEHRATQ